MRQLLRSYEHPTKTRWTVDVIQFERCGLARTHVLTIDNYMGWNDNPIQYDNGAIVYDSPERIPQYAKELTRQAFADLHQQEKQNG